MNDAAKTTISTLFTNSAHDALRVFEFAGYDIAPIMRECLIRSMRRDTSRINRGTVQAVFNQIGA